MSRPCNNVAKAKLLLPTQGLSSSQSYVMKQRHGCTTLHGSIFVLASLQNIPSALMSGILWQHCWKRQPRTVLKRKRAGESKHKYARTKVLHVDTLGCVWKKGENDNLGRSFSDGRCLVKEGSPGNLWFAYSKRQEKEWFLQLQSWLQEWGEVAHEATTHCPNPN